jgi:hypothetical protein
MDKTTFRDIPNCNQISCQECESKYFRRKYQTSSSQLTRRQVSKLFRHDKSDFSLERDEISVLERRAKMLLQACGLYAPFLTRSDYRLSCPSTDIAVSIS